MFKIDDELVNNRIDKILSEKYKNLTRTQIQKYIQDGYLLKNNEIFKNNSYKTKLNETFTFNIPISKNIEIEESNIDLDIIYEDNDLLVINKQSNLITHPNNENDKNTLVNALLKLYKNNLSQVAGKLRQGIIHRLDKDTTGLMVIAKNDESHLILKHQLETRQLKRFYIGFIWGVFNPKQGKIEEYMERDKNNPLKMVVTQNKNARYSITNYKTIQTFLNNSISMVEFNLDTGRTHQIRVHCNYNKHPIIGDKIYGGHLYHLKSEYNAYKSYVENFSRQALHSYKISFFQPKTNEEINLEIPLPNDIQTLYDKLKTKM